MSEAPQQQPISMQVQMAADAPVMMDFPTSMERSASFEELSGGDTMAPLPVEYPPGFSSKSRRSSVSAESDYRPDAFRRQNKRRIPKTADALDRIRLATSRCFLFSGLEAAQLEDIWASMEEMKVNAGDVVITQGQEGDYFYVIDSGRFVVNKRSNDRDGQDEQVAKENAENDGYGKQVYEYEEGGSFGELALMYNCPRAATVRALTPGVLWRVDRETFRSLIIDSTHEKRQRFEQFLETVPLLSSLSKQERAQVADALETVHFDAGSTIITQGEDGDKLFLILEGTAKATQKPSEGSEAIEVGRMGEGQYFGERSLITREPRAANVIAVTAMTCACMDRSAFERLLGPLKDIMKKHAAKYAKADDILRATSPKSGKSFTTGAGAGADADGSSTHGGSSGSA